MSKYNNNFNAWTKEEDELAIKGREEGLTGQEIKDKYFANSKRTKFAILSRLGKLRCGVTDKAKKMPTFYIETGLRGLFFSMERPRKLGITNISASGVSGLSEMHGHTIYEA